MIVVHQKEQARDAALDGAIVFHFSDRNVVAFGHVAIAVSEDADVYVRFINQRKGCRNRFGVEGRQVLHHLWEHPLT